ncbi:hypothetical protein D3C76_1518270 [compost metagenome]
MGVSAQYAAVLACALPAAYWSGSMDGRFTGMENATEIQKFAVYFRPQAQLCPLPQHQLFDYAADDDCYISGQSDAGPLFPVMG